ncbi:cobalamin biosynthesis protein [Limoniibacter endophyticus]|uniref:CobE/GbiG C-terminal domain-containing protein n=1 Tax=Limoniibacter endophyticus TaxID=1565040 RepID=A0A8J3DL50_9HYPH|nr:cobalamin biosynthesis protein [Limoniibacter endophyticus]GHC78468.1 hypothetical protein GCM10010136_30500 [Limoniibacter endophyticus]
MSARKAFIAGIGCGKGAGGNEIRATLDRAMAIHNLGYEDLKCLATGVGKMEEHGLRDAADALKLDIAYIEEAVLAACDDRLLSRSPVSLRETGTASLSEAAALAAGGPSAALLGPRVALGKVTCALAQIDVSEDPS